MAIITPALLTALNTALGKAFQDAYAAPRENSFREQVATKAPSGSTSNTFGWLGDFPALREWIGDRVVKDMKAQGYEITNKLFESTVGVRRVDIEDDNFGHYQPLSQNMGHAAAEHPDLLISELIRAARTSLCYDGQNFLDTDHPVYEKRRRYRRCPDCRQLQSRGCGCWAYVATAGHPQASQAVHFPRAHKAGICL